MTLVDGSVLRVDIPTRDTFLQALRGEGVDGRPMTIGEIAQRAAAACLDSPDSVPGVAPDLLREARVACAVGDLVAAGSVVPGPNEQRGRDVMPTYVLPA